MYEILRRFHEIGVGKFLEDGDQVCVSHAPSRKVAVRVEGHADGRLRTDDTAHRLDQLPLAIEAVPGHHGAMQAEQDDVHGHRRAKLVQKLVAKEFPRALVDDTARLGPGRGAFDQRPAQFIGPGPCDRVDRAAQGRRRGMQTGWSEKAVLEVAQIGPQRRKRIGFGRN